MLNDSTDFIENKFNSQFDEPQYPQQTNDIEELPKERPCMNICDVTLTADGCRWFWISYLLSSKKGEIVQQNGREPKKGQLDRTWG